MSGWGVNIRTSPADPGVEVVGCFRSALALMGTAYLEPAGLGDSPASQVYRETLAGFLATQAASQRFVLAEHTVLIRGDCVGALSALRKGSFTSPALQNVAILHNQMLISLGAASPLYLHAPGTVMKAEGIDGLSREVASARREHESMPALPQLVRSTGSQQRRTPWFPVSSPGTPNQRWRPQTLSHNPTGGDPCAHTAAVGTGRLSSPSRRSRSWHAPWPRLEPTVFGASSSCRSPRRTPRGPS